MTSCLRENILRYKINTAGNNFPLGVKRKSEIVYTSVASHKKPRRITRYKSVFNQLHACHRVLREEKLTVDRSVTQFPTLFSTTSITALRTTRIILPLVLYGCETWSLTLREERRLRVFENRVLRRVFGPKRDEVKGNGENYIMRSLVICTPYPILCGW